MTPSLRALALSSHVAIAVAIAAAASAQTPPVVFEGLAHTPLGNATLRLDSSRDALEVSTVDRAGGDGVAVRLPGSTSWTARLNATSYRGLPMVLSWNAFADGRRISTSTMRQSGAYFDIAAGFTGATAPTYSAQVYRDGQPVAVLGSLPPTAHIMVPISFCRVFSEILDCGFTSDFHNSAIGECWWRFAWNTLVAIVLPNGVKVTGNELRLVEEVRPGSQYPYLSFDETTMQTNAYALTVFSESVR